MSERRAFVRLLTRQAAWMAAERRRLAQSAAGALRAAAGRQERYDVRLHLLTMRAVDVGLDRIYGRYQGDPDGLLLRTIVAQNRETWLERFAHVAALDARVADQVERRLGDG